MKNSTPTGIALSNPFNGEMFNIQLVNLGISGSIMRRDKACSAMYTLQGGVRFGDEPTDASVIGKLIFKDRKPIVAFVQYGASELGINQV